LIAGAAKLPVVLGVEALALLTAGGAYLMQRRNAPPGAAAAVESSPSFPWNWALALARGMLALFVAAFLNSSESTRRADGMPSPSGIFVRAS
jgi:hypothetical protein